MIGRLKRLFSGRPAPDRGFDAPLELDRPTYAIGDVHGRHDLLGPLLKLIEADAGTARLERPRVIFLGDYVDRGEQSAETVAAIRALCADDPAGDDLLALRGNHEEMMLAFLDAPEAAGPGWLANGGMQTLLSYGVGPVTPSSDSAALAAAAADLAAAMGSDRAFLEALPTHALRGNVLFAHAGADPELPVEMQPERALLWGHPRFRRAARWDGIWVVHGHYITEKPAPVQGRVPVDTGAWFSGRLTAARIWAGEVVYLST